LPAKGLGVSAVRRAISSAGHANTPTAFGRLGATADQRLVAVRAVYLELAGCILAHRIIKVTEREPRPFFDAR
jgi:hypothetical protein